MHREESPEFVVHKVESRRRLTTDKHRARVPGTLGGSSSGAATSETPDAAGWPSLWDAEIDGPHAPTLVSRGRGSTERRDDAESFPTSVDPVKPWHWVILDDLRRMADALIQSIHAFKKAMRPRGPSPPMPA